MQQDELGPVLTRAARRRTIPRSVHTLITIPFSHYNERARWGLQRFGIPFRERAYMPGFHVIPVLLATHFGRDGRADGASTKVSTPVLATEDGLRLCDSGDIVAWACQQRGDSTMIPNEEVRTLSRELSESLGAHTRRVGYGISFDGRAAATIARTTVGPAQALAWRALQPIVVRGIHRGLGVFPARVERSIARVREIFAQMSSRLADHAYLVGDGFTLADLTFAALCVPVILPTRDEGYHGGLPGVDAASPRGSAFAHELRATPAGQHVLRMYAKHRNEVVKPP